jgi:hypothetical protein
MTLFANEANPNKEQTIEELWQVRCMRKAALRVGNR